MPYYKYRCIKCRFEFELKQSFYDSPAVPCPKCNMNSQRIFVPTPIIFKGSGFYVTDSRRSDGAKNTEETQHTVKGEAGKGEAGKGEAGKDKEQAKSEHPA